MLIKKGLTLSMLLNARLPGKLLLVLDYVDYRQEELEGIRETLVALVNRYKHVRLLLLARSERITEYFAESP